jgi:PAS domain S-box-containing protein
MLHIIVKKNMRLGVIWQETKTMNDRKIQHTRNVERYFNEIMDVLSDGIYISDSSGMTLKVNSMYEKLTGLKREEMEGVLVTDLIRQGKYDIILNPDIVKTGEPKTAVQVTKQGRKVILNGYPVFDKEGKVALIVTFVRDVTVLSQLKLQITDQQELIDKLHLGVQHLSKKTSPLIANCEKMQELLRMVDNIAQTDATVLLLGETGVGKDLLALRIHENSHRRNGSFFKIDCTTIPDNLIESELFGYEPGAFSGASVKGKPGLIEMAANGTIFLDEIGELPYPMQGKLLRVLQDQEIMRVGSTRAKKVDVRFIAATNKNLEEAVRLGNFRIDLFYRLRVAVIDIPPLRERTKDIPYLVKYFLEKYNNRYKRKIVFSPEVEEIFQNYKWPGNVRELEHLIQSLVVTCGKDVLEVPDLPQSMVGQDENNSAIFRPWAVNLNNKSLDEVMKDIEKELLRKAIEAYGTISDVAKKFKVDRTTIYRKLKKHSLL